MNKTPPALDGRYGAALRRYLARPDESVLQQAYLLGRTAASRGMGVLDMARAHQRALAATLPRQPPNADFNPVLEAAETVFLETLSPFEAAHRGFRETNVHLRRLNDALEFNNLDLARMNRKLETEVAQRRRAEQALRESKDHYHRLFNQARLMQQDLRNLSSELLSAQEKERERISRELHDEIGQTLTAISINLSLLHGNGSVDPGRLKEQVADLQACLAQTMETVHSFARELRPAILDQLGLVFALRSQVRSFGQRTGLKAAFKSCPEIKELNSEQKTVLFRVAQESLTNVAKHARAKRIKVTLRRLRDFVRLQIRDDGKAFNVDRPQRRKGRRGLGLLGMKERARLVNGRLEIRSIQNRGTTVSLEVPLKGRRNRQGKRFDPEFCRTKTRQRTLHPKS